jgi:hypothetical protein
MYGCTAFFLGFICMILGFWVVLPVLPGPTLSWVGLPLVLTVAVPANYWVLGTTLLITLFLF